MALGNSQQCFTFAPSMPDGVIGNTSDSGSEEFRFET